MVFPRASQSSRIKERTSAIPIGSSPLIGSSKINSSGGPANASISMSHYIYNLCFKYVPNFGYAAAMSFFILLLVAVLAFIQMRVGDKRD